MAHLGITRQYGDEVLHSLNSARGKRALLLLTEFHELKGRGDFVFGTIRSTSEARGGPICVIRSKQFGDVEVQVGKIYRVVTGIGKFRRKLRGLGENPTQLYLIATRDGRPPLYFGRISHTNVMPNVTANGGSTEVAHVVGWASAPMFFGAEVRLSNIKNIAEVQV